jgi:hypothetical protein
MHACKGHPMTQRAFSACPLRDGYGVAYGVGIGGCGDRFAASVLRRLRAWMDGRARVVGAQGE